MVKVSCTAGENFQLILRKGFSGVSQFLRGASQEVGACSDISQPAG